MDMTSLEIQLKKTLEDFTFSRSEKQDLRTFLTDQSVDTGDLLQIRKMAFELAQETCDHAAVHWLNGIMKVLTTELEQASSAAQPEVLFSPRDDCPARIQSLIRDAEKSLAICVFTITDDVITDEIVRAHGRGIKVRVISDNEKAEDRGSDIFRLIDSGIPVALDRDGHMHHKFAIFDSVTSLTGSYNWTRSAARFNHENILLSQEPAIARALMIEFEDLWQAYSR